MDTQWLKSAQENFREAMEKKDWDMARAIEEDVADKGFKDEALALHLQLCRRIPTVTHGYILGFLRKKNEEYKSKGLVPTLDLLIEDLTN